MTDESMYWISALTRSSISVAFIRPLSSPLKQICGITNRSSRRRSMSTGEDSGVSENSKINTHVAKLLETIGSSPDGWEQCWKERVTPWDLGNTTPIISHLLQTRSLPYGRTLVPGCGGGHDVVAMAGPERYVVGLDISDTAVNKARELTSTLPNVNHFTFLKEDFFNWHPSELFDLIFDYTFFCAIDPDMRPAWAKQISDLLKPDGELITLMFPIDDHEGGPPHKVSVADYGNVLNPVGIEAFYIEDNELAIESRKGREKLGRWKKSSKQSLL